MDSLSFKRWGEKALQKKAKQLDAEKKGVFVGSKMRDAICCDECGRPRLIYSMKVPKKALLATLDAYKEGIDYQCGGCLFDADEVAEGDPPLKALAETFHVRQALTCRDAVESSYYNYTNTRGSVDLEWVCSLCGAGPDESPLDPATCGGGDISGYSGFALSKGQMVLPMCVCCRRENEPVLVGTTKQVDKERERQAAKKVARKAHDAKKQKGAAPPLSSGEEEEEEEAAAAAAAAQESGSGSGDGGGSRSGGASGGGGGGGSRSGGREKRKEPPPPENFSSTSGAAKRRAAKAAKEAAANAPGLRELIEAALAGVAKRGLGVVSRSMLRANVKTIDLAKRDFKDKDEWKKVLKVLQEAGKLTYDAVNDSISLPA